MCEYLVPSLCVEQRMQQSHEQQQGELRALQEELQSLNQRREEEKEEQGRQEELALLTQQAERAEESARQFAVKLQEKVSNQRYHRSTSTTTDSCTVFRSMKQQHVFLQTESRLLRMIHRPLCGLSCMQMSFLTGGSVLSDCTVLCKSGSKEVQPVSCISSNSPVKRQILKHGQVSVVFFTLNKFSTARTNRRNGQFPVCLSLLWILFFQLLPFFFVRSLSKMS